MYILNLNFAEHTLYLRTKYITSYMFCFCSRCKRTNRYLYIFIYVYIKKIWRKMIQSSRRLFCASQCFLIIYIIFLPRRIYLCLFLNFCSLNYRIWGYMKYIALMKIIEILCRDKFICIWHYQLSNFRIMTNYPLWDNYILFAIELY